MKVEQRRELRKRRRAELNEAKRDLTERNDVTQEFFESLDQDELHLFIESILDDYGVDSGRMSLDRQPKGTYSRQGSNDGATVTRGSELDRWLHQRQKEVINHPWWDENPHWSAEVTPLY